LTHGKRDPVPVVVPFQPFARSARPWVNHVLENVLNVTGNHGNGREATEAKLLIPW
jgi:hypothetical protein